MFKLHSLAIVVCIGINGDTAIAEPNDDGKESPKEKTQVNDDKVFPLGARSRLKITLSEERDGPLAYSPGSKFIALADSGIVILHANNGRIHQHIKGVEGRFPLSIAIGRDERVIVLETDRGQDVTRRVMYVRDARTGKELRRFDAPWKLVLAGAITANGLVAFSGDRQIVIWNWRTGKPVRTLDGDERGTSALALSANGEFISCGAGHPLDTSNPKPTSVTLWDVSNGKRVHEFKGHQGRIVSIALSPNGNKLAAADSQGMIRVWKTQTGNALWHSYSRLDISSAAFNPEGTVLIVSSPGHIYIVDAESRKKEAR